MVPLLEKAHISGLNKKKNNLWEKMKVFPSGTLDVVNGECLETPTFNWKINITLIIFNNPNVPWHHCPAFTITKAHT